MQEINYATLPPFSELEMWSGLIQCSRRFILFNSLNCQFEEVHYL